MDVRTLGDVHEKRPCELLSELDALSGKLSA
jgi:hypothetical protein